MIKIQKDDKVLRVTRGAYLEQYAPYGWKPVGGIPSPPPVESAVAPGDLGEDIHTPLDETPPEEPQEPAEDLETTLSHMNLMELRQYASLMGIRTKNLKNRESLIEAILQNQ